MGHCGRRNYKQREPSNNNHNGVFYMSATAGQDRSAALMPLSGMYISSADQYIYSAAVKLPTAIADVTHDYYCHFGLGGLVGTALSTVGIAAGALTFVGFEYDRTVSANWLISTSSASNGNFVQTSSGVAAAADTWTEFSFVYIPNTPTCSFSINGTSVGTISTAGVMPIANDPFDVVGLSTLYLYRIAGAANRWFHTDYVRIINIRTTKRA